MHRSLSLASLPCCIGPIHRDFGPGNVIVSRNQVIVCDAAYNGVGPQLLDIADFIAYLRLLPILNLRGDRPYRALTKLFLKSYFGNSVLNIRENALLELLIFGALDETSGAICIGFEASRCRCGLLPVLIPSSAIAGHLRRLSMVCKTNRLRTPRSCWFVPTD